MEFNMWFWRYVESNYIVDMSCGRDSVAFFYAIICRGIYTGFFSFEVPEKSELWCEMAERASHEHKKWCDSTYTLKEVIWKPDFLILFLFSVYRSRLIMYRYFWVYITLEIGQSFENVMGIFVNPVSAKWKLTYGYQKANILSLTVYPTDGRAGNNICTSCLQRHCNWRSASYGNRKQGSRCFEELA